MDDDYRKFTKKDYGTADYLNLLKKLNVDWDGLVNELNKFSGSYFIDEIDPKEDKIVLTHFFFSTIFCDFVE